MLCMKTIAYQTACLLKFFNVNLSEETVHVVLFPPVLGVLELLESFLVVEATRAEETAVCS
jgi:hypothetical protein